MTSAMQGKWNDGHTAASRPVRIERETETLAIFSADGELLARWPGRQVRLVDEMPDGGLRLRLDDGSPARLRVGPEWCMAIAHACTHLRKRDLHSGWRMRPLLVWSAAAMAGFLLSLFVLIPWAADVAAENMPLKSEQKFGQRTQAAVHQWLGMGRKPADGPLICVGDAGHAALDQVMRRLTAGQPARLPLVVEVLNIPMVNAFALPGGHIILTRGLLDFVESEGELAGVLAHEVGHIEARHNVSGMVKRGAAGFLIGLFFGDAMGGLASIGMAEGLLNAAYSRNMETDADALAIQRLLKAGLDPAPTMNFFARLAEKERDGLGYIFTMVDSHPASADRAAQFAAAAKPGQPVLAAPQWRALKEICSVGRASTIRN